MERMQFTFYRSYYEAVTSLPKKDQSALFLAICAYALDEKEPTLTGTSKAIFSLVRPTLDASRRKAESGRVGGSKNKANEKQRESKEKANGNQIARENKKEKENKIENKIENKCLTGAFDVFWDVYPKKTGKGDARKAFSKVKVPVEVLVAAVETQKQSVQWQKEGGQYIPNPSTWLNQGRWEDELLVNTAKTGCTHEESVVDDLALLRQQLGMRGGYGQQQEKGREV